MNYYDRHIGDYLKDTVHLSLLEHGIYGRLLDIYYTRESALPLDQVMRLVGARTDEERSAVRDVLNEFFTEEDGVYKHSRCDREIARYQEKQRKASVSASARWNKSAEHTERNANAMRTHSEGNALQTPDTRHQTPDPEINTNTACATDAGRVCVSFKAHGINDVNPGHPGLLSLIAAGATDEEFIGAASTAKERGKGFAYAIGMLKRQRAEAAQPPPTRAGPPEPDWRKEQRERNEEFAGPASASRRATKQTAEVIDVTARRLG